MELERLEKEIRLPYRHRQRVNVAVVREHYLRDDISCKINGCVICSGPTGCCLLTCSGPLAIPDVEILRGYLEVFEQPDVTGVILLETAVSHLRSKAGQRLYSRALKLLSTPNKECVYFSNEHHLETFDSRKNESLQLWQCRLVHCAAVWYSYHLTISDKFNSVIIITQNKELYTSIMASGTESEGVKVMTVKEYLMLYYPHATEVYALYESLHASLIETGSIDTLKESASVLHNDKLLVGNLNVSPNHPKNEAFVSVDYLQLEKEGIKRTAILIHGQCHRGRAIHGDKVAVELLPESQWRGKSVLLPVDSTEEEASIQSEAVPTGVVVSIVERADQEYVASFPESSEGSRQHNVMQKVLVFPYDIRIPKIRIATKQAEQLRNHRIVVRIDSWDQDSQYPNGHFVRSIGPIGTIDTEMAVIMIGHGLSMSPFSTAATKELPVDNDECPWRVDEDEASRRRDLRHSHLIFSIDPKGCEDVDDTLSVRYLDNGILEFGVHIADVSYFVQPGSHLDREARARSTTVYLADRRYDMLPAVLSSNICSLLSNVDRYAVSMICQLDSEYRVMDVWCGRTVIRSAFKLSYEIAQVLYDGGTAAESVVRDIPELWKPTISADERAKRVVQLCTAIQTLVNIARVLHSRRSQNGAVELESVEVRVQLSEDDSREIKDLIPKQPLEMHETIAECMIFANMCVAKRIYLSLQTSSLLRRHPPPSSGNLTRLEDFAHVKGWKLKVDSNKSLAESLDMCVDPTDPSINQLFRIMATGAMSQAEYFSTGSLHSSEFSHYGLALEMYTHFTSPIRRYADIVVHRQLLAVVGETSMELLPSNTELVELSKLMNSKHRSAKFAQLASVTFFQTLYFVKCQDCEDTYKNELEKSRCITYGIVSSIKANGVKVFIPRYGIRGPVYLKDRNGLVIQPDLNSEQGVMFAAGTLKYSPHSVTVTYNTGAYSLKLFDHVKVKIGVKQSRTHSQSVNFQLLTCGPIVHTAEESTKQNEIVKVVADDCAKDVPLETTYTSTPVCKHFMQSDPNNSLYFLMQEMQQLSIKD